MPHCRFSDLGEASGAHGTEWVAEGDRWPLGWLRQYVQDRLQTRRYQVAKQPPGRTSRRAIARWKTRVNALCPPGWSQPSASRSLWHDRGPPRSNFHDVKQRIRSRGAMRPSFARFSAPSRGGWSAKRRTRGRSPCVSRRMGGACEAPVEPCAQGRPPLGAPTVALVATRELAIAPLRHMPGPVAGSAQSRVPGWPLPGSPAARLRAAAAGTPPPCSACGIVSGDTPRMSKTDAICSIRPRRSQRFRCNERSRMCEVVP
jgi:hypothetical protein